MSDDLYMDAHLIWPREVGTFVRVDDPINHSKGFHRMADYNDSISRIAAINLERCNRWHTKGINSWSLSDWSVAFGGEVGELFNVVKKVNRIRDKMAGNKPGEDIAALRVALGKEIADCYIYLDLLAQSEGINLAEAVREKFNETSERVGFPERL